MDTLKLKKAWEVAIAPAKQLPMSAIGMYMTGNSLQIFSIYMVFTLFKGPISALLGINAAFTRFETDGTKSQMLLVKLAYVVTNLLSLGLGIYKVNAMGLLPYVCMGHVMSRSRTNESPGPHAQTGLHGRHPEYHWNAHIQADVSLSSRAMIESSPKMSIFL